MSSLIGPEAAQSELEADEEELPGQKKKEKRAKIATGEGRTAFYLIFPAMLLLAAVIGYPIFYAVYHFLAGEASDNGTNHESSIGDRSQILCPDTPDPSLRMHHQDHIHCEVGM